MERNNRILHITSWYLVLPDTGTLLCITHTLSFSLSNSDSASVHHYHCLCLCLVSVCVSVSSSVPVPFPIAITVSVSVSITLSFSRSLPARHVSPRPICHQLRTKRQRSNCPTRPRYLSSWADRWPAVESDVTVDKNIIVWHIHFSVSGCRLPSHHQRVHPQRLEYTASQALMMTAGEAAGGAVENVMHYRAPWRKRRMCRCWPDSVYGAGISAEVGAGDGPSHGADGHSARR